MVVIGIAAQGWASEGLASINPGGTLAVGPYEATLDQVAPRKGPNYEEAGAFLTIRDKAGDEIGKVETGRRFIPAAR